MTKVAVLEKSAEPQVDPVSVARVELRAAIERRAAADSALAQIRAAEKQSSRARWAAKAAVEKLRKQADDAADVDDDLVASLAGGETVDVSQTSRDRAAALDKARADVARWEEIGAGLRGKVRAAVDEVHWAGAGVERARDHVLAAIGADRVPGLLRERAALLESLAAVNGSLNAFRDHVVGDMRTMLEKSDADLADKMRRRMAPEWLEFAERLLVDADARPPLERSR